MNALRDLWTYIQYLFYLPRKPDPMREAGRLKQLADAINATAKVPNALILRDLIQLDPPVQYTMIAQQVRMDRIGTARFLHDVLRYARYRKIVCRERMSPVVLSVAHALLARAAGHRASGDHVHAFGTAMAVIVMLSGEVRWWLPKRSVYRPVILHAFDLLGSLPVRGENSGPFAGFVLAVEAQHYVSRCRPFGPRYKARWLQLIQRWLEQRSYSK